MNKKLLSAFGASLFIATQAMAQSTNTPVIDQRETNQQNRISNGVSSGQLTPTETQHLDNRETHLNNAETKAKSDGTVTAAERRHLKNMENRDSRAIRRDKHNAQTAN